MQKDTAIKQSQLNKKMTQAIEYFTSGQDQAAEQAFQQLYQQQPTQQVILYLAQLAQRRQAGSEWIEQLEALLHKHPDVPDSYYILARSYQQNRQLPLAAQTFYQALGWRLQHDALTNIAAVQSSEVPIHESASSTKLTPENALHLLLQTLSSLKKAGFYAFPTAGTLLGLEREGQLLENDKDVDIGIDWSHMESAIEHLQHLGWHEEAQSYGLINPRCFRHQSGLVLDLCGYATEQSTGDTISGLWMQDVPFTWNRVTRFSAIQVVSISSPAGEICYPQYPEQILQALYGLDWKIPDANFDTIVCAPNIMQDSYLYYCYAYSHLYTEWKKGNFKKMHAMLKVLLQFKPHDGLLKNLMQFVLKQMESQQPCRVLALGFFDLLHPGHLTYLSLAKSHGDYLVVGVAPDAFALKSKGRPPIMDQDERLSIIKALACVDKALLVGAPMADTERAAHWIAQQSVNLVICGDEWQHTPRWQALEAALAPQNIRVVYIPYTQGISSTKIKERIQNFNES
ncbi:adenylyltransferase/cytidyltransferase family protein [Pseudoalteromonas piscicida]|uniref:adenylyltransferase/cytidyltransferase family protein n=1 Tax=Pseudoalteromonas piscicida TaxID=43662 RepID=UPI0005FA1E93|nr:adenylyltransferase/cytidyltransferase family protein [Pseudoalteromonas piscicida]KJY92096.1 cytidyltransferase [Pseudoalteromonas piscicida]